MGNFNSKEGLKILSQTSLPKKGEETESDMSAMIIVLKIKICLDQFEEQLT